MKYYKEFSKMIQENFKRLSRKQAIKNVKEEVYERVDIFCGEWESKVFDKRCSNYYDIDLYVSTNPIVSIVNTNMYIVIGGFYGTNKKTYQIELLAVGILDIQEGKCTAYCC